MSAAERRVIVGHAAVNPGRETEDRRGLRREQMGENTERRVQSRRMSTTERRIPPVIHYCWFGRGKKPRLAEKCIASWRAFCPDYSIMEWNEDNFDWRREPYARWCLEQGKWAFLSDYARLVILKERGGVYLDTDVELRRNLDPLLQYEAYFGFENEAAIATGLGCGAIPGHPAIESMLNIYLAIQPEEDGSYRPSACPALNTQALIPFGLRLNGGRQRVCGAEILPPDYLNPYDDPTGVLRLTENTYSIHWYGKSWIDPKIRMRSRLMKPLHRVFGTDAALFRRMRKRR